MDAYIVWIFPFSLYSLYTVNVEPCMWSKSDPTSLVPQEVRNEKVVAKFRLSRMASQLARLSDNTGYVWLGVYHPRVFFLMHPLRKRNRYYTPIPGGKYTLILGKSVD